jgi:isopenicillin N synthase-like dioxygenase
MNFGDFKDSKAQQPLPPSLKPHESEINDFADLCNKTCTRILNLLALGLEVRTCTYSIYISPSANGTADTPRLLHNPP